MKNKYYSEVLKYYGLAMSIPIGNISLKIIQGQINQTNPAEILLSMAIFIFSLITLAIGGIIYDDE